MIPTVKQPFLGSVSQHYIISQFIQINVTIKCSLIPKSTDSFARDLNCDELVPGENVTKLSMYRSTSSLFLLAVIGVTLCALLVGGVARTASAQDAYTCIDELTEEQIDYRTAFIEKTIS